MRIAGLAIDGFGLFCGAQWDGVPEGLAVVVGENEAGKTTLLAYIRTILFGFPRQNRARHYPPLRGGKHGGRLSLALSDGAALTIERYEGANGGPLCVRDGCGEELSEAALRRALSGATPDLFAKVYGFGLGELQEFESLRAESVKSVIYGASVGSALQALPRARERVDEAMKQIFLPRGKNPQINTRLKELNEIRGDLRQAVAEMAQYDGDVARARAVREEIERLETEIAGLRSEANRVATLLKLWPEWIELQGSRADLDALPEVVASFPAGGVERLERFESDLEEKREALAVGQTELAALHGQIERLSIDEAVLAQADAIGSLAQERQTYFAARRDLPALEQKYRALDAEIQNLLGRLGPDWTEERALALDRSIEAREAIQKHKQALGSTAQALARAAERCAERQTALDRTRREAEETRAAMGVAMARPEPSAEDFASTLEAIGALRRALPESHEATRAVRHAEERLADKRGELGRLERAAPRVAPIRASGICAAVALLSGGALAALVENPEAKIAAIGFAVLGLVALALLALRRSRQVARLREHEGQLAPLREETAGIELRLEEDRQREAALLAEVRARGAALGLPADAPLEEVQRLETHARSAEEKHRSCAAAREALESAESERNQAAGAEAGARALWHRWLGERGMPPALSPETALEAFGLIENCRKAAGEREELAASIAQKQALATDMKRRLNSVLRALERPEVGEDGVAGALERLERDVAENRDARLLAGEKAKQERDLAARLDAVRAHIARREGEVAVLLEAGSANDADAFRRRADLYARRVACLERRAQAERNMLRIAGERDIESFQRRLEAEDRALLEARSEQLDRETSELKRCIDEKRDTRADLDARLARLAGADDVARLREQEEETLARIRDDADAWRRLAVAKWLLDSACEKFEKEHQPGVVRDASAFFARITGGRYEKVFVPVGGDTIEAVAQSGARVAPDALSRGTAEQLYLALRFGYVRHRARETEPLPVVMDDVLVNFDAERSRRAAETVLELGRSHQVLFFTCHPATVRVFRDVDASIPVFRLRDGRIEREETQE